MQKLLNILLIGFTFVALNVGAVAAQTGMTQSPVTDGMPSCAATSPDFVDNGVCDGPAATDHSDKGKGCVDAIQNNANLMAELQSCRATQAEQQAAVDRAESEKVELQAAVDKPEADKGNSTPAGLLEVCDFISRGELRWANFVKEGRLQLGYDAVRRNCK